MKDSRLEAKRSESWRVCGIAWVRRAKSYNSTMWEGCVGGKTAMVIIGTDRHFKSPSSTYLQLLPLKISHINQELKRSLAVENSFHCLL